MSMLYLIRHGQASAHLEDYDQLSKQGKTQGELIGQALQGKTIAAVYIGPRKRHLQTYEMARQEDWPMAIQTYWLDEFPAHEIIDKGLPILKRTMPNLLGELNQIQQQVGSSSRAFHKVLQKATQLWIDGKLDIDEVESFEEYKQRLLIAKRNLCIPREGNVLCFTSAGFISSFVGLLQGGDDWQAIRSAWALYNGSFTTYKLENDGNFLACFNWIEHIEKEKRTFL